MWILFFFFFCPSTEAARRWERSRHWNTQRYPKIYRSNTFLRETNFESDTTPKIHFSMWRALNKSNSMVCDSNGKWMHDYLSVCAKSRNTRGLWRKEVQRPDPSVPWRGQVTSVLKWRLVGVTSSRSGARLPISKQMSSSGDACGGDDNGGHRHRPWPGAKRASVHGRMYQALCMSLFLVAQQNAQSYWACKKRQSSARSNCQPTCSRQMLLPLPPPFGGRRKAHACTTHTVEVRFLKA